MSKEWVSFVSALEAKGVAFEQVQYASDVQAVVRAVGIADALSIAVIETEWRRRLAQNNNNNNSSNSSSNNSNSNNSSNNNKTTTAAVAAAVPSLSVERGQLRSLPEELQDAVVTAEVLSAALGCSGALLTWQQSQSSLQSNNNNNNVNSSDNTSRVAAGGCFVVAADVPASMRSVCEMVLPVANAFVALREVELAENHGRSLVAMALAEVVAEVCTSYASHVAKLQHSCTSRALPLLGVVADILRTGHQLVRLRQLLPMDLLTQRCVGSRQDEALLTLLLRRALVPYLHMLRRWMDDGVLHDPLHEFFVVDTAAEAAAAAAARAARSSSHNNNSSDATQQQHAYVTTTATTMPTMAAVERCRRLCGALFADAVYGDRVAIAAAVNHSSSSSGSHRDAQPHRRYADATTTTTTKDGEQQMSLQPSQRLPARRRARDGALVASSSSSSAAATMSPSQRQASAFERRFAIHAVAVPTFLATSPHTVQMVHGAGKCRCLLRECQTHTLAPSSTSRHNNDKDNNNDDDNEDEDNDDGDVQQALHTWCGVDALQRAIHASCARASSAVMRMLLGRSVDLLGYLTTLKTYFLQGRGDWLVDFLDSAAVLLSRTAAQVRVHSLRVLLQASIARCVATDAHHDRITCSFARTTLPRYVRRTHAAHRAHDSRNNNDDGGSEDDAAGDGGGVAAVDDDDDDDDDDDNDDDAEALPCVELLQLEADVPWPLTLVLDAALLRRLNAVFRLLLWLRRCERELCVLWHHNDVLASFSAAYGLKHQLTHFLRQFQFYAAHFVVEPQWSRLQTRVAACDGVDDVTRALRQFCDAVEAGLLLASASRFASLASILDLTERFCAIGRRTHTMGGVASNNNSVSRHGAAVVDSAHNNNNNNGSFSSRSSSSSGGVSHARSGGHAAAASSSTTAVLTLPLIEATLRSIEDDYLRALSELASPTGHDYTQLLPLLTWLDFSGYYGRNNIYHVQHAATTTATASIATGATYIGV